MREEMRGEMREDIWLLEIITSWCHLVRQHDGWGTHSVQGQGTNEQQVASPLHSPPIIMLISCKCLICFTNKIVILYKVVSI